MESAIPSLPSYGLPEYRKRIPLPLSATREENGKALYTRYAKKTDLKPLLAAIEVIDYGNIKLTAWIIE